MSAENTFECLPLFVEFRAGDVVEGQNLRRQDDYPDRQHGHEFDKERRCKKD